MRSLLNPEGRKGLVCEDMVYAPNGKPILRLDGSFGAASEEVVRKIVVVCAIFTH